jgi:predicted DNA-binding transcriptional regulator AlpA
MHDTDKPFLSEDEAASKLGISPGTLRNWRSQGRGPHWATNPDTGRFFGYTSEAVDEWLARAVGSTPEVAL